MLLGLAAIWGASFMFIKISVRELEPSTLVAARLVLATLTLAVMLGARTPLRAAVDRLRQRLWIFFVVAP